MCGSKYDGAQSDGRKWKLLRDLELVDRTQRGLSG